MPTTTSDPQAEVVDPALSDGMLTHVVMRADLEMSALTGWPVRALCGYEWVPVEDPSRFPLCQRCAELAVGLP